MTTLPGITDQDLAQSVLDAYADRDRLTRDELEEIGFNETQTNALSRAFGPAIEINDDDEVETSAAARLVTALDGQITDAEERRLDRTSGLSDDFIAALRGDHGTAPLIARARWLADNAESFWWRDDYDAGERRDYLLELASYVALLPRLSSPSAIRDFNNAIMDDTRDILISILNDGWEETAVRAAALGAYQMLEPDDADYEEVVSALDDREELEESLEESATEITGAAISERRGNRTAPHS